MKALLSKNGIIWRGIFNKRMKLGKYLFSISLDKKLGDMDLSSLGNSSGSMSFSVDEKAAKEKYTGNGN